MDSGEGAVMREVQYEVLCKVISHAVGIRLANFADQPPEGMLMVRDKVIAAGGHRVRAKNAVM